MPYYIDGQYYYTQVELRATLNRLLETCWMYSHSKSEYERKYLTDSITSNFKMDHPEFETRTEADDIAMKSRHEAYMAEEEVRRQERAVRDMEAQKASRLAHLRAVVARGYHPEFYEKFCRFVDKCKAGIGYRECSKIGDNSLYLNPQSFVEVPKERFYRPIEGDVISILDGGLQPILVSIRHTPILELFNLENSIENTYNEYIYGMVLDAPEGVPYPKDSRIILQIKFVCGVEKHIQFQKQENSEFDPVFV
jgi:hypothetical protein